MKSLLIDTSTSHVTVSIVENNKVLLKNNEQKEIINKTISNSEAIKMMITEESVGNFVCTKMFKKELL